METIQLRSFGFTIGKKEKDLFEKAEKNNRLFRFFEIDLLNSPKVIYGDRFAAQYERDVSKIRAVALFDDDLPLKSVIKEMKRLFPDDDAIISRELEYITLEFTPWEWKHHWEEITEDTDFVRYPEDYQLLLIHEDGTPSIGTIHDGKLCYDRTHGDAIKMDELPNKYYHWYPTFDDDWNENRVEPNTQYLCVTNHDRYVIVRTRFDENYLPPAPDYDNGEVYVKFMKLNLLGNYISNPNAIREALRLEAELLKRFSGDMYDNKREFSDCVREFATEYYPESLRLSTWQMLSKVTINKIFRDLKMSIRLSSKKIDVDGKVKTAWVLTD
jgi:hypothetical protein